MLTPGAISELDAQRPAVLTPEHGLWGQIGCKAETALFAPLRVNGELTGGIIFRWRRERAISDDTLDFASAAAEIVALAVEKARIFEDLVLEKKTMQVMNDELAWARDETARKAMELRQMYARLQDNNRLLAEANKQLEELADRDGMTGVANHRSFQLRLREELARATRHEGRLSLIMLDVDHFKRYNDTYGHPKGDQVLRLIADTIVRSTRSFDFVARYGGEEFAIILPRTGRRAAKAVAERIREAIEREQFPHQPMTASLGVSTYPSDADAIENLVTHADAALYAAKRAGRNQVVSSRRPTRRRAA